VCRPLNLHWLSAALLMLTLTPTADALFPIAVETLRCGESFDFALYIRTADGQPVLYRGSRFPFQRNDLNALDRRGVRTLYVAKDAQEEYTRYLREQVMGDKSAPPAVRYCALREANRTLFDSLLQDNNVSQVVELAESLATDLTTIVHDEHHAITDLDVLLCHDYRAYAHATNVGAYTALLARRLGISDKRELEQIIVGAMLHDLGKRHVPAAILNKRGRLTESELKVVKRHPAAGFRELSGRDDLTWAQLMMVYQHHERLDGKGYPTGIVGDEIPPWSRMCAITNVYDGMTCSRPYRDALPIEGVQEYFLHYAGSVFDAEMVRCWLELVAAKEHSHDA
jgi:HD-GYP domain-containing protein (c-di-GMP phosphodiesterase class II)